MRRESFRVFRILDFRCCQAFGNFKTQESRHAAVPRLPQVMAALAAREAGIPHIQALLHQSLLQVGGPGY